MTEYNVKLTKSVLLGFFSISLCMNGISAFCAGYKTDRIGKYFEFAGGKEEVVRRIRRGFLEREVDSAIEHHELTLREALSNDGNVTKELLGLESLIKALGLPGPILGATELHNKTVDAAIALDVKYGLSLADTVKAAKGNVQLNVLLAMDPAVRKAQAKKITEILGKHFQITIKETKAEVELDGPLYFLGNEGPAINEADRLTVLNVPLDLTTTGEQTVSLIDLLKLSDSIKNAIESEESRLQELEPGYGETGNVSIELEN